jgi:hypothetical protein
MVGTDHEATMKTDPRAVRQHDAVLSTRIATVAGGQATRTAAKYAGNQDY